MSKILNNYENHVDKAWYKSSNIIYTECDDNENDLKTLRITFGGGRTYQYEDVKVNDYLLLRESMSQGQAFNRFIKQYEGKRIEDRNLTDIEKELDILLNPQKEYGLSIEFKEKNLIISKDKNIIYDKEISEETKNVLLEVIPLIQNN